MSTNDIRVETLGGSNPLHALLHALPASQSEGDQSIGEMLNAFRTYLMVVAAAELPRDLAGKVAPSDLVQDTMLEAHLDAQRFRGVSKEELLSWLRQILRHNLLNAIRRYRQTAKRQVGREIGLAGSSASPIAALRLADPGPGPRSGLIQSEEERQLLSALKSLPNIYREVIELRNRERLTFVEIGQRIGRSEEAARKLWARAVETLRARMQSDGNVE